VIPAVFLTDAAIVQGPRALREWNQERERRPWADPLTLNIHAILGPSPRRQQMAKRSDSKAAKTQREEVNQ